MFSLAFT